MTYHQPSMCSHSLHTHGENTALWSKTPHNFVPSFINHANFYCGAVSVLDTLAIVRSNTSTSGRESTNSYYYWSLISSQQKASPPSSGVCILWTTERETQVSSSSVPQERCQNTVVSISGCNNTIVYTGEQYPGLSKIRTWVKCDSLYYHKAMKFRRLHRKSRWLAMWLCILRSRLRISSRRPVIVIVGFPALLRVISYTSEFRSGIFYEYVVIECFIQQLN
jgi:hypothetical protein